MRFAASLAAVTLATAAGLSAAGCGGASPPPANPATDFPPYPAGPLPCAGKASALANTLQVGYAGDLSTVGTAGFALRYQYLAGVLAPVVVAPGLDCLSPSRTDAKGCGTAWWGTWQWDAHPPGEFVTNFADATSAAGLLPMFTYYLLLPAARDRLGITEGRPEVTVAAVDVAFMTAYLDDFRFFLRKLGTRRAIVHVEPDFWGYAQQAAKAGSTDANGLAAAVASANAADCAGQANTIAGLGRCLVAMARKHAPSALVSLHASAWASGFDCVSNTMVSLDVAAEAVKTADFLRACGADGADLVTFDISDRDAAWYDTQGRNSWLDASDTVLPSFAQAFRWSSALTARLARPGLWWQVPLGNRFLSNTCNGWQDNKLDYFFDHPDRVAASGAIGVAFGSGATCQTSPETDGGRLMARARTLLLAGGQPLCP